MAMSVRDKATEEAVRRLSGMTGKNLTDTIRSACEDAIRRLEADVPLSDRLEAIAARADRFRRTGRKADKAFFDHLSGGI
jgi:antitoxin VapB